MHRAYLFHLHFYVDDPQQAERAFVNHVGMNVVGRAGLVGSNQVGFAPEAGWEGIAQAGARFRQTQLQRGAFDLILGPGHHPEPLLEHFGMRVDEETYEQCKNAFMAQELPFCEGERRSFFPTAFGIRMELIAPHHNGRGPYMDVDYDTLRVEKVRFAVPDPPACQGFFTNVLGENALSQFEFEWSGDQRAFRPVEVQLSSSIGQGKASFEILPGIRWVF